MRWRWLSKALFLKKKIKHISESTAWNLIVCFFVCPIRGLPKYIQTKVLTTCFNSILSFFKKTEGGLEMVFLPYCLPEFWRKIFLTYSIIWPNFPLVAFTSWYIGYNVYCDHSFLVCDVINIFLHDQNKWRHRFRYSTNEKSF